MKIMKMPSMGMFAVNCYMMVSDAGNAALIDAPCGGEAILRAIAESGAKLQKILLTHGHCDHIESLTLIAEKTGAQVYIHSADEAKLHDDYLNLSDYFAEYYDEPVTHYRGANTVSDGDIITLDEVSFRVMHTPGHTSGSVCYLADEVMFSGDTLFKRSGGRTDIPDGDTAALMKSLKMLDEMTEDYALLSGHGEASSLFEEKRNNPYMKGFGYDDMF